MRIKLNIPAPEGSLFHPDSLHYQEGMHVPFRIGPGMEYTDAVIVGARVAKVGRAIELELEVDLDGIIGTPVQGLSIADTDNTPGAAV